MPFWCRLGFEWPDDEQVNSDVGAYLEPGHAGCRIQQVRLLGCGSGIEGEHPSRSVGLFLVRPVFFINAGIIIRTVLAEQFRQNVG